MLVVGVTLHLYVAVTTRFEGGLWKLPSKLYSGRTLLRPGVALGPDALVRRLERCGYARARRAPSRPGQFRRQGAVVELYPRSFDSVLAPVPRGRVSVRFGGEWIASLRTEQGRHLPRLELEPELLATMYGPRQEERELIDLQHVPERFIQAVLAAEDSRFFSHGGLDLRAVFRAAFANLRSGRIVQGGSTITQQTVKNLFLGQQRTWWRKLREVPMSLLLDLAYPKQRILEVYLNDVYLGQRGPVAICGVQAASRFYFGRDLADLTLGEAALVAGLIRSPGRYNPFANPEHAYARRNEVLEAMFRLGFIDRGELERARPEELQLGSGRGGYSRASYLVDFTRSQLAESYSPHVLEEQGLSIYTTVDTALQESAEQALRRGLEALERDVPTIRRLRGKRTLQGAIVVVEPATGAILAMVGGREYSDSQFNRAVQAKRQPGSCFKPFVYAAGFELAIEGSPNGLTPATVLEDSPVELVSGGKLWRPQNYDGEFRGPVTVATALQNSLNVPTVRAAQQIGLERIVDLARRAGFTSALAALPSMPLGAMEVTPLELASAYGTLAGRGLRVRPQIVREVRDRQGGRIERGEVDRVRALDPRAAFLVTHLLEGVFEEGTARSALSLGFSGVAAGKTGTTDETRDAWFVGYTPDLLALVWVGFDDNARTGLTGASGALPIWVDFMKRSGRSYGAAPFEPPPGVVEARIDPQTGGLAVAACPEERVEVFAEGTEPQVRCPLHRRGLFDWLRNLRRRER